MVGIWVEWMMGWRVERTVGWVERMVGRADGGLGRADGGSSGRWAGVARQAYG